MLQSLLRRTPGSSYREFGALLHGQVPFDRLTLCALESGGTGLRVLHALAGDGGTSEAVGRLVPKVGSLAGAALAQASWRTVQDLTTLTPPESTFEDLLRARKAGMRSALVFPLLVDRSATGVCLLWSRHPHFFGNAEHAVLEGLQPALSASLRHELLYVEARRHELELRALEQLARATRKVLDLDQVIPACVDAALGLFGHPAGGLLLQRDGALELVMSRNLAVRGPLRLSPGDSPDSALQQAFVSGRPVLCPDVANDPALGSRLEMETSKPGRRVWLVAIPLLAAESPHGVVFACGLDTFGSTPAELDRLAMIGHFIGSAIADAERHHRDLAQARRQVEERQKQEQLESLSNLAGGLAHDLNNTMGAVLLVAPLLRETAARGEMVPPGQLLQDLDVIIDAARRGSALAGQLLAFSRGTPLHLSALDIDDTVRQTVATLPPGGGLHIETQLAAGLPQVRGDREQIARALTNVLRNAAEATPRGGRLRITTRTIEHSGSLAEGQMTAGRYVRIAVTDQGPGIDPAVRARLFEPFVTTKKSAAGLGLAVAFGVVRAHGGNIAVERSGPDGTTLVIDLPQFQQLPVQDALLTHQAARVLVVDDEPVLLRIAARILRKQGYEVETAQNGAEALLRYVAPSDYDLLLLDSTMPGMSGREVLEEILRRDPGARVLVMSGYSVDCGPAELLARGAREFLPKPFTPQELLDALRRVLSGESPDGASAPRPGANGR